jgi:hypothetical protein
MGLVTGAINKFATSRMGTKLYSWAASEKGQRFTATSLPTIESAVAGTMYVIATERQKNLDRREKNVLQWQNVLSSGLGITLGTFLNKKAFDFGEKVIKYLDEEKIESPHKVHGAIRVLGSIFVTASIMRFVMPVLTAYISGEAEEYKAKKKKLDVKV